MYSCKCFLYQARAQDFLQGGGGGNDGRVQRDDGGLGLINIRLRYIASIEYSERFFFWGGGYS